MRGSMQVKSMLKFIDIARQIERLNGLIIEKINIGGNNKQVQEEMTMIETINSATGGKISLLSFDFCRKSNVYR
jgi:hypothetical protein